MYLGVSWGQTVLHKGLSFPVFAANIVLWPVFMLITMVSCLIVKPNYVIKEEEL